MFTQERPKTEEPGQRELQESYRTLLPKADIYESEGSYMLIVDLPGAKEENISITVDNSILTVDAKPAKQEMEGYHLVYTEFALAKYRRQFNISEIVDTESITADLKDGTLRLTMPKHASHKPRTIKVQAV